jgi:hypothetical protein
VSQAHKRAREGERGATTTAIQQMCMYVYVYVKSSGVNMNERQKEKNAPRTMTGLGSRMAAFIRPLASSDDHGDSTCVCGRKTVTGFGRSQVM